MRNRSKNNFVKSTGVFILILVLIIMFGIGCNDDDDSHEIFLLSDNFSAELSDTWSVGTNTVINPGGETVEINDGEVVFSQGYDYIQTRRVFGGNFRVEMDVRGTGGSIDCADVYVEMVGLDNMAAMLNFSDNGDSINIGRPPVTDVIDVWDCVADAPYLNTIANNGVFKGLLKVTCEDGLLQVSFRNSAGRKVATPWVAVSLFSPTSIRI